MTRRLLVGVAIIASCNDPVHSARVDALGGEAPNVPPGATHRPGQPCLTCHGGQGPSNVEFAVAGTVFQTPDVGSLGQPNVRVLVYDAPVDRDGGASASVAAMTNEAGNFYIRASSYSPIFPLRVTLDATGLTGPTEMHTRIGRDGSCATCHFDPAGRGSPGHVYLVADVADLPDGGGP